MQIKLKMEQEDIDLFNAAWKEYDEMVANGHVFEYVVVTPEIIDYYKSGRYKTEPIESVLPKKEEKKPFFIDEHRKVIDNKNTVKIEKVNKMEKSDIFYNPDIFVEEGDYVLGGFNAEDLNGIDVVGDISALSYPKLEYIFEKRLKNAIENFKKEIRANITKSREDIDDIDFDNEIYNELSNLTETYLGIKLKSYETDDIASQIMADSSYTTWTERIKERVGAYKLRIAGKFSDVNENKSSSVSVKEAEYDTQTATLEQMLERLFNINEENTY